MEDQELKQNGGSRVKAGWRIKTPRVKAGWRIKS